MQQPKIEVRVRDERRRDETRAKWSTVVRERAREREWSTLSGGKKPDGKQNNGENTRKWGKEKDERRGTQQLRGYVCNESLSEREDQQHRGKSGLLQREIRRMDANSGGRIKRKFRWQEAQMCFLYLTYILVFLQRTSSEASRSNGPGRVRT